MTHSSTIPDCAGLPFVLLKVLAPLFLFLLFQTSESGFETVWLKVDSPRALSTKPTFRISGRRLARRFSRDSLRRLACRWFHSSFQRYSRDWAHVDVLVQHHVFQTDLLPLHALLRSLEPTNGHWLRLVHPSSLYLHKSSHFLSRKWLPEKV